MVPDHPVMGRDLGMRLSRYIIPGRKNCSDKPRMPMADPYTLLVLGGIHLNNILPPGPLEILHWVVPIRMANNYKCSYNQFSTSVIIPSYSPQLCLHCTLLLPWLLYRHFLLLLPKLQLFRQF